MSVKVLWYGDQVAVKVKGLAWNRLVMAGKAVLTAAKKGMNRAQPVTGAGPQRRGLNPSAKGEYPKRVTGYLLRNTVMEEDREQMAVRVGTNVIYGRWLELGTRNMKRRPWLTLALRDSEGQVRKLLGG